MEKSIVIDLEMCRIGKEYRRKEFPHRHEIIQVGAVKLNEEGQITDEFNTFVHPIFGKVDHFIESLTGINDKMLSSAPLISEVLQALMDWAGEDCKFVYAWSSTDRSQLIHEIDSKHISLPGLKEFMSGEHWIDYQKVFGKRFKFNWPMSLQQALDKASIETQGHVHNGLDDAYNTARLISKLEMDPQYVLQTVEVTFSDLEDSESPSGFSLGELFSSELLASLRE